MNYYFAPMEGITDYLYRQIVWRHFPYAEKLYAPFIQPNEKPVIVPKEYNEICPENNQGIPVVPQILTRDAEGFIRVGEVLESLGYQEINLNLGCPSKVVVSKGKGSGLLADTDYLDKLLDTIFSYPWKCKITVKTRLGLTENTDFKELLTVYSRYPIHELTIHPRYRSDYYSGEPRLDEFAKAFELCNNTTKICYNGNINSTTDRDQLISRFPDTSSIMCGRGALANPALFRQLKGGSAMTKNEFISFHNDLYETYQQTIEKEKHFLHKLQEMWTYWNQYLQFDLEIIKKIRGVSSVSKYTSVINRLFDSIL